MYNSLVHLEVKLFYISYSNSQFKYKTKVLSFTAYAKWPRTPLSAFSRIG